MSAAKVAEYLDAIVTREVVDLVQALVWPVLILGLLVAFRRQLRDFADRITHVRVGGQEFVARTLESSQVLLQSVPLTATRPEAVPKRVEREVLELAATDPQAALIRLGREIDRSVRLVAVAGNWLEPMEKQPNPLWRRLVLLSHNANWDADVLASTLIFSVLEEAAVSGDTSISREDMKRLVDQGLTVLGLVNSIPHDTHVVLDSSLTIYEDEALTRPMPNRFAVLLKTISHDGRETIRPFLTSRPGYYKPGMKVGYEWKNNPPTEEVRGWVSNPMSDGSSDAMSVVGWDFQGRDLADFDEEQSRA
jgi:hypothetical protein